MLKDRRVTLIVIPEEGGHPLEYKLARNTVWIAVCLATALAVLLVAGVWALFRTYQLGERVARLDEENGLLQEEVAQIRQLDQALARLQRSNRQLRTVLGERSALTLGPANRQRAGPSEREVSGLERLRYGRVYSVPCLWPLDGSVARAFTADFPAVLIAAPVRSLVRASAAGRVVQAGYDVRLGYVVVIDHGGGLVSKYGYASVPLVEVGRDVVGGEPIALSGRSGGAPVPGLYYAVVEGGTPQDPQRYRLWL
jgi:murein DD-endopeptidase MepM/ murein hydrolase activator NlpD